MKLWKRFGAALLAAVTTAAMLTGPVLAAEPDQGISVQIDGQMLAFTDAVPEAVNGRTYLPFRAVLEAMGAEVDYDGEAQTVSAKRDGVELAMVIGERTFTVTENGQTRTVEMDAAPYVKADRTYIPIRYAAEAFGYSVGWDQDDKTAILADVDALFKDVTFDLMDNFAAYCGKQEASRNMGLTGKLTAEMTDKTGELSAEPIKISGTVDGVSSETGVQLALQVKMSGLAEWAASAGGSPMEQAILQAMLGVLSDLSGEVRADLEKEIVYISLPAELTGMEDTWFSLDLGAYKAELLSMVDMDQLTQLEDATVKEALVWVMKSMPLEDKDFSYPALAQMARLYAGMLGDQAFTQEENSYVNELTLEDIVEVKITLAKDGNDITAVDLTMTASVEEDGDKMAMTMTEHAAPDKVDVVMDMTLESVEMGMAFHMDMNCAPTDKAPEIQPPANAQILPLEQLIPME